MPTPGPIEYANASPRVKAVYDEIMTTRKVDWINNFWKMLANDPETLERTWRNTRDIMAPGTLDAVTKELIYLAVSATNGCEYCLASHTASARKKGMTDGMHGELMAVIALANGNNALASGYRTEVDEAFK